MSRLWKVGHSLSARLALFLLGSMAVIFALAGWAIISHHRAHLEEATWASADRVSDVIERSTSYSMLRNDREGLLHVIDTIADEPGMRGIRIYNEEGRIMLSTQPGENGVLVSTEAETCAGCHGTGEPLSRMDRHDRFSITATEQGERILGIINPIENRPECWNAACHAHPPDRKILGVLETRLSLARADAALADGSSRMTGLLVLAAVVISLVSGAFVLRMVHRPVKALTAGTGRLSRGELGYQIEMDRRDELGELARSFNRMSRLLKEARDEAASWARTLETRVEQKSRELEEAHDHMVHVEKMASLGKLAATVAHEINNPLAGILTYSKLARRWAGKDRVGPEDLESIQSSLAEIETESRRCGEIVRNLLMFSRSAPINLEPSDLNAVVHRCLRLIQHKMDLAGIQADLRLDESLPLVTCDAAQMEQVLIAILVNAVEAMPRGGNVSIRSSLAGPGGPVRLEVQDDGPGIPPELMETLFEPFVTTKDNVGGVGLGLAVSRQIIQRHGGVIKVASDPGKGTTFTIELPHRQEERTPTRTAPPASSEPQGVPS